MNSPTGKIKEAKHSIPDDPKIRKACKIAYLGWYSKYGDYVVNGGILAESKRERLLDYVFTQQYIWYALGQSEATFKDEDIQKDYENFKKDIDNQMKKIETRPSFIKNTITIECGETKVLTDSNNVLKDYNSIDVTKDGVRIEHSKGENTMKITVDENCNVEALQISDKMMENWGCIKEETVDKDTTIYFTFEDNQYWVEFIDLKGCFSSGNTLQEAMENSKEAMDLFLEDLTEFPECTTDIKKIKLNDNQIVSFVSIDLEEHRKKYENKSVKKTLSIPAWLNTLAEKEHVNFSKLLQSALMEKLNINKSIVEKSSRG